MNILGLGIDIVNINRIRSSIKKNKRFKEKIFSKTEILDCNKKKESDACYAKRFAAKEAFSKSLGTGIAKGLNFKEIIIKNDNLGKQNLNITGKSLITVKKILKRDKFKVFLSVSDDKPFAIATVIISK